MGRGDSTCWELCVLAAKIEQHGYRLLQKLDRAPAAEVPSLKAMR